MTQILIKCNTRENRPYTSPGQTTEADLVDRDAGESPQECEHGRQDPSPHLPYGSMREGEKPSPPLPIADRITGLQTVIIRLDELTKHLISCSIQQHGPCTSPVQHRRTGLDGVAVCAPEQKAREQEKWFQPLLLMVQGELDRVELERSP